MIDIQVDKLGFSIKDGITKESFHGNGVNNAIFRITVKNQEIPTANRNQLLNEVCSFLRAEFPPYKFDSKGVCLNIQAEEGFLKQIDCQIYW